MNVSVAGAISNVLVDSDKRVYILIHNSLDLPMPVCVTCH